MMKRLSLILVAWLIVSIVNAQEVPQCPGFLPSRLIVGQHGRVTPGDANNVRSQPVGNSDRVGQIPAGGLFTVLDGPICAEGYAWWQVDYNGLVGWTVEGSGDTYWLEPIAPITTTVAQNAITAENIGQLNLRELDFTDLTAVVWSSDSRWAVFAENDGIWIKDYSTPDIGARLAIRSHDIDATSYGTRGNMAFDAEGSLVYQDGRILRFVDPATGELRDSLEIGPIDEFIFSADGSFLVVRDYDVVQLWDLTSRSPAQTWELDDEGYFTAIASSPNSSMVAAADNQGTVSLWGAQSGMLLSRLQLYDYGNPEEYVYDLAFSPNGARLAGATHKHVALWDVAQGRRLAMLAGQSTVSFNPDGRLLLTSLSHVITGEEWEHHSDIVIYEAETGVHLASLHLQGRTTAVIVLRPDGTAFYTVTLPEYGSNQEPTALEWTLGTGDAQVVELVPPPEDDECPGVLPVRLEVGREARVLPNLDQINLRAQPSTSSSVLAQMSGGDVFDVLDGPQCALGAAWWQINFQGERGWVSEGLADHYLLQPIADPPETPQYAGNPLDLLGTSDVQRIRMSSDGRVLAVADAAGIWLYDVANLDADPHLLYLPDQQINDMSLSADGELLAASTGRPDWSETPQDIRAAWLWDLTTETVMVRLEQDQIVTSVALSPDGRFLAVSQPGMLYVWQVPDGYEYGILDTAGGSELIFNPDSRHLLVNHGDTWGQLWDVEHGSPTRREQLSVTVGGGIDTPGEPVFADPTFSSDGLTLVSHVGDAIIFWNGITGVMQNQLRKVSDNPDEYISLGELAFSPDDAWLASSGDRLRLWDTTFNSVTVLRTELVTETPTHHVTFSPDGGYLLAGSSTSTELWDAETRERIATLRGSDGIFTQMSYIVTFDGRTVYVWDLEGNLAAELHT